MSSGLLAGAGSYAAEALHSIARGLLGTDVSEDVSLFEAGLDSLGALEIHSQLCAELSDATLPESLVTDFPTLRQIEAQLHARRQSHITADPLPAAQLAALLPLLLSAVASPPSLQTSGTLNDMHALTAPTKLRCLMLHGGAGNAQLMELLMRRNGWLDSSQIPIDFVFVDGPFQTPPLPQYYNALTNAGLYGDDEYFNYGVRDEAPDGNTRGDKIHAALAHVSSLLKLHAPINAIGGMCEGSLIAATVAAVTPTLSLFINFCGLPWEDLPISFQQTFLIATPSIHMVGTADEMLSMKELMSIPSRFAQPIVLVHQQGHVVPVRNPRLGSQVAAAIENVSYKVGIQEPSMGNLHLGKREQPQEWASNPGDVIDSLTLLLEGTHAKPNAQAITSAHIKFFGSVFVMIFHFTGDNPHVKSTFHERYGLHGSISNTHAWEFSKVIGLAPFIILLGHAQQQHLLTPTRFVEQMFPLAALLWLCVYSGLPHAFLAALHHAQLMDDHGTPREKHAQLLLRKLLNPMWFIYMTIAYLTVTFTLNVPLHMLTLARHVMPRLHHHSTRLTPAVCALLSIAAAIWLDGAQPFESPCAAWNPPKELCLSGRHESKHVTLINRAPFKWVYQAFPEDGSLKCLMGWESGRKCEAFLGSFSVRYIFQAFGGDIIRGWWMYAVAPLLLPTEFPARLPGEGRSDGLRSTIVRLLWVGGMVFVCVHSSELFNEQSRGMVQICFNFACRFVAVVGFMAAFPRSPNVLTEFCYFSAVIYPFHEYLLMVLELPVAHGIARLCWSYDLISPLAAICVFAFGAALTTALISKMFVNCITNLWRPVVSYTDTYWVRAWKLLEGYRRMEHVRVAQSEKAALLPTVDLEPRIDEPSRPTLRHVSPRVRWAAVLMCVIFATDYVSTHNPTPLTTNKAHHDLVHLAQHTSVHHPLQSTAPPATTQLRAAPSSSKQPGPSESQRKSSCLAVRKHINIVGGTSNMFMADDKSESTPGECCLQCDARVVCAAWSFNPAASTCVLKKLNRDNPFFLIKSNFTLCGFKDLAWLKVGFGARGWNNSLRHSQPQPTSEHTPSISTQLNAAQATSNNATHVAHRNAREHTSAHQQLQSAAPPTTTQLRAAPSSSEQPGSSESQRKSSCLAVRKHINIVGGASSVTGSKGVNVTTPGECCLKCDARVVCAAWSFNPAASTCVLKKLNRDNPFLLIKSSSTLCGFKDPAWLQVEFGAQGWNNSLHHSQP